MSLIPETESDIASPPQRGEKYLISGQRIYLAGDTREYIILPPGAWVAPAPDEPESPRGGWMP